MDSPRSMLRIFGGCTSVDLRAHRHAARRLIEKFDEHAVVMEDSGPQDGDATQVSLAELASADVYILLLAWRYGTIPPHETLSVTHLEYQAARAATLVERTFLLRLVGKGGMCDAYAATAAWERPSFPTIISSRGLAPPGLGALPHFHPQPRGTPGC